MIWLVLPGKNDKFCYLCTFLNPPPSGEIDFESEFENKTLQIVRFWNKVFCFVRLWNKTFTTRRILKQVIYNASDLQKKICGIWRKGFTWIESNNF